MSGTRARVAADIGGTFTDIALIHPDGRIATRKVPSTPNDYGGGVIEGIRQILAEERLGVEDVGEVLHACTVATNAILEAKGARTALITTPDFATCWNCAAFGYRNCTNRSIASRRHWCRGGCVWR
jgi:N-methylhydantoinase A